MKKFLIKEDKKNGCYIEKINIIKTHLVMDKKKAKAFSFPSESFALGFCDALKTLEIGNYIPVNSK